MPGPAASKMGRQSGMKRPWAEVPVVPSVPDEGGAVSRVAGLGFRVGTSCTGPSEASRVLLQVR